ncbi:MAG: extracellular solute-binding protein [Chloroflexaceae bacterium]|nr:extracellular solute-binding protein [Chloroflexaceae bacterium]
MKRYRFLSLALICVVILSACSFGAAPGPAPTPGAGPGQPSGTVVVGFAAGEWERQIYEPLIEQFNQENPGIQVVFVPSDEMNSTPINSPSEFTRRLMSMADTAAIYNITAEDIANGYFYNLTDLMAADASFNRDDFYLTAISATSKDGAVYGLPRSLMVPTIRYNKDLWAARGLPAPDPNLNWADLLAYAEQIASKQGNTVETYGLIDGSAGMLAFFGQLQANGSTIFTTSPDEARMDDPKIQAALERMLTLIDSGAVYGKTEASMPRPAAAASEPAVPGEITELVASGRVGLWMDMGTFVDPSAPKPAYTTGVLPLPEMGLPYSNVGNVAVMSSGTQHPQEAWRWLEFLSRQWPSNGGDPSITNIPARKSVAESSGFWAALDADTRVAVEAGLSRDVAPISMAAFGQVSVFEPLSLVFSKVVQEKTPINDAIQEAQNRLDELVAQVQLTPVPTPDTSPIVVATPVVIAVNPNATRISFIAYGSDTTAARRIARNFNSQNPDVFVEIKEPDYSSNQPITLASIAATTDCFSWYGPPTTTEMTATLDLQPLLDADASFNRDDIPPALMDAYRQGNMLSGLPFAYMPRLLIYNKNLFESANVAPPQADWSMVDMIAAAQQLAQGSGNQQQYGYVSTVGVGGDVPFFLQQAGVRAIRGSGDDVAPNYTDPALREALAQYIDLLRKASPYKQLLGYSTAPMDVDSWQFINEGRAAMWFDFGFYPSSPEEPWQRAFAPPPVGPDGTINPGDLNVRGLHISATSEHANACWQWLTFMSSDVSNLSGSLPARLSVADSAEFQAQAQPGQMEMITAFRPLLARTATNTNPGNVLFEGNLDTFWFFRAIDRAFQGGDLEKELAEAQKFTEEFLTCARGKDAKLYECAKQVDPTYEGFNQPPPPGSEQPRG